MNEQSSLFSSLPQKLIKGIVVLCLFGLLFYFIPLKKTVSILSAAELKFVCWLIVIRIVLILISSYKLHILLHKNVESLVGFFGFCTVASIYFIGRFFSNFLPTSFGGDVIKVRELTHEGVETDVGVAGVFMDRLTGITAVFLIGVVVAFPGLNGLEPYNMEVVRYPFLAVTVLVFAFLNFWGIRSIVWVRDVLEKWDRVPGDEFLTRLIESFNRYSDRMDDVIWCFFYALAYHLLRVFNLWIAILAIGTSVNFFLLVPVIPIITFVSLLPITINSLGIREGAITFLLTAIGLTAPEALAVAILIRIVGYSVSLVGGYLYFLRPHKI